MKLLQLLILIGLLPASIHSQVSGYLGQKVQIEVNLAPGIMYHSGSFTNQDLSEYLVVGGSEGLGGFAVYGALNTGINYTLNRKVSLGASYHRQRFFSLARVFNDYFLMPSVYQGFEVIYNRHIGIAPLKKFYKIGLGYGVAKPASDFRDSFSDFDDSNYLFNAFNLIVGIGSKEFITNNFYVNYGVDMNVYLVSKTKDSTPNRIDVTESMRYLRNSSLYEINLGVGFNF